MKKIKRGLCCLLLVAMLANLCCFTALAGVDGQGDWGDQGNGTFVNPILNADYSDPDIIRVGEKYYMISHPPGQWPLYPRLLPAGLRFQGNQQTQRRR